MVCAVNGVIFTKKLDMIRWISLCGQLLVALFLFGFVMTHVYNTSDLGTVKMGAVLFVLFKIIIRFQEKDTTPKFSNYIYILGISLLLLPATFILPGIVQKIGPNVMMRLGGALLVIESVVLFTLEIRKKK